MAPGQDDTSGNDDTERERFSRKLDGYEAMGLRVDDLRRLLEEDLGEFKATYLGVIRAQLEGGGEETPSEEPTELPEEEPEEIRVEAPPEEVEEEPSEEAEEEEKLEAPSEEAVEEETEEEVPPEELAEEELEEDMELALEGAGPEEVLAKADIPEEEGAPEEEEVPEEEEALEEEELPAEEEGETLVEEAPGEEETPEEGEVEISIEEEEPHEEAPEVEEEEEAPPEPEEEAEIEVGEAPEERPEEEVEGPEEEEEEALIVVAEVVGEEGEAPEEETEVRLVGLTPEERVEEPHEEVPEPEKAPVRPVKRVVPKAPAAGMEPKREVPPKKAPPEKAAPSPPKRAPARKATRPHAKKGAPKKEAPKKRTPARKAKRRAIPTVFFVVLVAALIVVAGAGTYFVLLANNPPTAGFTYDPDNVLVGQTVTYDASKSFDPDDDPIERYVWDFGDGESGSGRVVKHSYIKADTFRVRLTVEDDRGATGTVQFSVEVDPLEVSMERPNEGDVFTYDVEGNASLENPTDGLFTFSLKGVSGEEHVYSLEATIEGEKSFEVTGTRTAKDGFMKDHDNARLESTHYDLSDVSGQLFTSLPIDPRFTGSIDAYVDEDVCQQWERVVRSDVEVYTDFHSTVGGQDWATLQTSDEGTFYSQLTGIDETFSLNEFMRQTTFNSEDKVRHNLSIGSSVYQWQVKGMERVGNRDVPSLHVNVTMDRDTLQANDLDSFFIDVWLEPGLSQPSKYHVYVKGHEEGNRYTVDMTETLKSGTMGTEKAWGLPCGADHGYTVKGDYPEDFNMLDPVPEQGGTAGGFQFSPEEAYQEALNEADFATYMSTHPNAFFHLGNYTENGDTGVWEMDFGQKGSSEHYWVRAKGQSFDTVKIDDSDAYTDSTLPISSPSEIGEVVTLSRGMRLMRAEPEIGALCFDGQEVAWDTYTFNLTEGVSTISLDPTTALVGAQETGYVYMLESRFGPLRHRAALDATNGQVLFTWKHSETHELKNIAL